MRNTKKPDQDLYAQMASQMTSPESVIYDICASALGMIPSGYSRVINGIGNEVYKLEFIDSSYKNLMLRIHHGIHKSFWFEKWAIEKVSKRGVPVPTIIKVGEHKLSNKIISYSIETYVNGKTLDELLDGDFSEADRLNFAIQAGRTMAQIHSVTTKGYGQFVSNGVAIHDTLASSMQQRNEHGKLMEAISDTDVTREELEEAIETIDLVHTNEPPHLIHVDFAPKHIIIDGNSIKGVIDFEICMSGHAAVDFNRWRAQDSRISMKELISGYEQERSLPSDFWTILYTVQVHSALQTILYHYDITHYDNERHRASEELKLLIETKQPIDR